MTSNVWKCISRHIIQLWRHSLFHSYKAQSHSHPRIVLKYFDFPSPWANVSRFHLLLLSCPGLHLFFSYLQHPLSHSAQHILKLPSLSLIDPTAPCVIELRTFFMFNHVPVTLSLWSQLTFLCKSRVV